MCFGQTYYTEFKIEKMFKHYLNPSHQSIKNIGLFQSSLNDSDVSKRNCGIIDSPNSNELLEEDLYTFQGVQKLQKGSSDVIFGGSAKDRFKKITIPLKKIKNKHAPLAWWKKRGLDEDVAIITRLMQAIKNKADIPPIVIDENFKIMDGLHRFYAHKELDLNSIQVFQRVK